ncbi:MAG: hypothetical protein ABSA83_20235 [Verrucomicrobiota bacterium]
MSKRGKIRPTLLRQPAAIKPTPLPPARVSFSFKYLQADHGKFQFSHRDSPYFCKLLDRLKHVCELSWQEMRTSHKDSLRCHDHKWHETTEPKGFGLKGQLADCQGWQFALSSNEHGRVHGFFLDDVFFVVWLDPDHKLYNEHA